MTRRLLEFAALAVALLALGFAIANIGVVAFGHDDLEHPLEGDYLNHYEVTAIGAELYFSRTDTDLVASDEGFRVRRLVIDCTAMASSLTIKVRSADTATGQETFIIPAGIVVELDGHWIESIDVDAGPTAPNPLTLIAER